jgi:pimeloyl-ACP methyl ester carboxylesterase
MSQTTQVSEGRAAVGGGIPTAVFVHGAFADASSWAGVIAELQTTGVPVRAVANPLRSLSSDSAYVASVVDQVSGPVLLVGHSYGGAVVANAAPQAPNVVGLVFVAAFIPDEGESILGLAQQATDSLLGPALRSMPYSTGPGQAPGTEFTVDPASFHAVVAADLPAAAAAVAAVSQRPAADAAFAEPSGPVGWKTLPCWAIVSPSDRVIGPGGERLMAERSGAQIVEVDASHLVMVSQPTAVADLIRAAASSVTRSPKSASGVA